MNHLEGRRVAEIDCFIHATGRDYLSIRTESHRVHFIVVIRERADHSSSFDITNNNGLIQGSGNDRLSVRAEGDGGNAIAMMIQDTKQEASLDFPYPYGFIRACRSHKLAVRAHGYRAYVIGVPALNHQLGFVGSLRRRRQLSLRFALCRCLRRLLWCGLRTLSSLRPNGRAKCQQCDDGK